MKIKAQKREIVGKKVKHLRKDNQLPAVVYGPNKESTSLIIDPKEFLKVFREAGHNKIIDLEVEGEKNSNKIIIQEVQKNSITDKLVHANLYQIDMAKKISVEIPIEITGESKAVKNNLGFLVNPIESLKVLSLPDNIPGKLTINIDTLQNVNDSILVKDIKLDENLEWDSSVNLNSVIVRVSPPQKEVEQAATSDSTAEAEASTEKSPDAK